MSELAFSARLVTAAMQEPAAVEWPGSVWIATIDDQALLAGELSFPRLDGFATARLLVRSGRFPRGFIEVDVLDGVIDETEVADAVRRLPSAAARSTVGDRPAVSVVLCTFDRPVLLYTALRSLLALSYPCFEVVVVDNNPSSGSTAHVVASLDDPRIRLVDEPRPGLARARNRGAQAARFGIVAFTDDDVCLDQDWLEGIADGFAAGANVACVSGIVPSGEIVSPSQAYFDRRVSWARNCRADLFSLDQVRRDEPLFPFQVGRFGTGANFALRRDVLFSLGGFDEGLGIGSHCGGGEDIDIFVRVLLAGHQLAYEPSALVWHRHRADLASLVTQIDNYGTGLGAFMTKLALHPRTLAMMCRRVLPGVAHLRRVTRLSTPVAGLSAEHHGLWKVERRAVLHGPIALARSRWHGARAHPLRAHRRAAPKNPSVSSKEDA